VMNWSNCLLMVLKSFIYLYFTGKMPTHGF